MPHTSGLFMGEVGVYPPGWTSGPQAPWLDAAYWRRLRIRTQVREALVHVDPRTDEEIAEWEWAERNRLRAHYERRVWFGAHLNRIGLEVMRPAAPVEIVGVA